MANIKSSNFCIVLSSPSGAGKTSISKKLLSLDSKIQLSISCTTRLRRKGEVINRDYIFIADRDFENFKKNKKFLEFAEVFGHKYGTLKKTVNNFFNKKKDVLFDIDWQGYQQLKQSKLDVIGIFILPPNKKELINRLIKRGRDSNYEMKKRMSLVKNEISHFLEYDYIVINKNIDVCTSEILQIIKAERLKRTRLINLTEFINKFRD